MARSKKSEARRAEVEAMAGRGLSVHVVAEAVGLSESRVQRMLRDVGMQRPRGHQAIASEAEVRACHALGMTDALAAEKLGCAKTTFANHRRRLGLAAHQLPRTEQQRPADVVLRCARSAFAIPPRKARVLRVIEPAVAAEMAAAAEAERAAARRRRVI